VDEKVEGLEDTDDVNFPGYVSWHYTVFAVTARWCDRKEEAIRGYTKALEIGEKLSHYSPASTHATCIADIYEELGDLKSAEVFFRKSVELADRIPTDREECPHYFALQWRRLLLDFYERHGRSEEAKELAKEMKELLGRCPSVRGFDEFKELMRE
jgi:tetratricopeptide (TPR) repeat protein